jgi:LysM repeat protein
MIDHDDPDSTSLPMVPKCLCPNLGTYSDPETYSASLDIPNYCLKSSPPAPVSAEHQVLTCCSEDYKNCPIYKSDHPLPLPLEWLNLEFIERLNRRKRRHARKYLTAGFLMLLVLGLILAPRLVGMLSKPTVVVRAATRTLTPTALPSLTPTSSLTPTPRPSHTPTITVTPEDTITPLPPTPGPELETPFGKPLTFLVHLVKDGESYTSIATTFNTKADVIRAINNLKVGDVLRTGTILVIMPGKTDLNEIPVLKAEYLNEAARVDELATQYNMDADELRRFNDLGSDAWTRAQRWIVVRMQP